MEYVKTTYTRTPIEPWTDSDGKMWVWAYAHAALTAKTPYKVVFDEYGFVTAALTTASGKCYIGFPQTTGVISTKVKMQVGGYIANAITPSLTGVAGYGCYLTGGVLGITGADYVGGSTEIGAFQDTDTGTTHDLYLRGEMINPRTVITGATTDTDGAVSKAGTASATVTSATADTIMEAKYYTNSAATGTARGMYLRLYLTGGAGGEALRVYTTVSNAAPVDTVNGAHISINFGASAGNVTGQSSAIRATYHIANRTMTGTNACINADLWADGTSSAGSNISFFRCVLGGDATGVAAMLTTCYWFNFDDSVCDDTNGMVDTNRTSNTASGAIRILVNGTARYISYGTGS